MPPSAKKTSKRKASTRKASDLVPAFRFILNTAGQPEGKAESVGDEPADLGRYVDLLSVLRGVLDRGHRSHGLSDCELVVRVRGSTWTSGDVQEAVDDVVDRASERPGKEISARGGKSLRLTLRWHPLVLAGRPVSYWRDVLNQLLAALPGAYREIRDRPDKQNRDLSRVEAKMAELIEALESAGLAAGLPVSLTLGEFLGTPTSTAVQRFTPEDLAVLFADAAGKEFQDFESMKLFSKSVNLILRAHGCKISSPDLDFNGHLVPTSPRSKSGYFQLQGGPGTAKSLGGGNLRLPDGLHIVKS